jgi:hypothetical protein
MGRSWKLIYHLHKDPLASSLVEDNNKFKTIINHRIAKLGEGVIFYTPKDLHD